MFPASHQAHWRTGQHLLADGGNRMFCEHSPQWRFECASTHITPGGVTIMTYALS